MCAYTHCTIKFIQYIFITPNFSIPLMIQWKTPTKETNSFNCQKIWYKWEIDWSMLERLSRDNFQTCLVPTTLSCWSHFFPAFLPLLSHGRQESHGPLYLVSEIHPQLCAYEIFWLEAHSDIIDLSMEYEKKLSFNVFVFILRRYLPCKRAERTLTYISPINI